ncbi:MAG TPA: glutamine amidotransferase [Chloroflexota bacterium]|nr:glutamine amidotransferase [Chloroflexota bacterium]
MTGGETAAHGATAPDPAPDTAAAEVIVLRHVPWEGLGAFAPLFEAAGARWRYVDLFAGAPLPELTTARAVVAMGGPMGVYDTAQYPYLTAELAAIGAAVHAGVSFLGVCLGSQLLAAALGAPVTPNPRGKEIGWGTVTRRDDGAADAILRFFAPSETVLHWHGDIFALPRGAVSLASSAMTQHQAFRWGRRAWGLLFHVEADAALLEAWLQEPVMREEASRVDPSLPGEIARLAPVHLPALGRLQEAVVGALLGTAASRRA